MFRLSISIGNTVWALLFNEEEAARDTLGIVTTKPTTALNFIAPTEFTVADDYGQTITGAYASVHGTLLEDLDKSKLSHIELALHQQLTQMEAQKRWENHPAHRAMARGPSVIAPGFGPMGNGAFPRN